MRLAALWCLLSCLFLPAVASGHERATDAPRVSAVQVTGASGQLLELDLDALAALPPREIEGAPHGDAPARWTGVALVELLQRVGAPVGEALRGRGLANVVRVTATDGYQVVFALAELDAGFAGTEVLLAYRRDGDVLTDDGPFRLVVPGDRRAGRWARNVAKIELLDLRVEPAPTP